MRCLYLLFLCYLPPILTLSSVIAEVANSSQHGAFKLLELKTKSYVSDKRSKLLDSFKKVFSIYNHKVSRNSSDPTPKDAYLNIKELTAKYGYGLEEHTVQTEDGYKLTLHKIPPVNTTVRVNKNVHVLLMHGLMDSSDSWVLQGRAAALAYVLADRGYTVWLGNARGNKYSSSHVNLTTTQSQFWKFSWEEIGLYDLPAMIDYILQDGQNKSLYYIGHSQGTTSFFVMASLKPEYNNKIRMMFALSPVAYMGHVRSPIVKMFSPANYAISYWLSNFNTYSSSTDFFNKILSMICYVVPGCDNLLYMIVGNNHKFTNESLMPVVLSHLKSGGASTLQFLHYGQLVASGRFCRYDFGEELNKFVYGSDPPPAYELSRVTTPVQLFYSENDWLSDPRDVQQLAAELPDVVASTLVPGYNHLDFLYATNAKTLIYSKIMDRIERSEYIFLIMKDIHSIV
ncbi:alpha/beta hydrolase fold domain-containing protein [Phthorimaea operculella]|nr:alpha/beta hydrolase fold domain-containing protein [Phthorimaea operculella]